MTAGCASTSAKTDDDVTPAAQQRLFVQYGYYLDGTNATKFSNHTLDLLIPGAENVMVVSASGPARAHQWAQAGGVFAWEMPRTNRYYSLEAHLALGNFSFGVQSAVAWVKQWLVPKPPKTVADYKYIALDELGVMPAEWRNGGNMSERFVSFLEVLAEDGYNRRLITYVNAYNMGNGSKEIGEYSQILRACVKYCRAIGLEVYTYTEYVFKPTPEPVGKCFHSTSCLTSLAHDFEAVAPGLNRIAFTTLGVSDVYLQNSTKALCIPSGALRLQVQTLLRDELTATQQGIGTYSLMDSHFMQAEHADCLAALEKSWPAVKTDDTNGDVLAPMPSAGVFPIAYFTANIVCSNDANCDPEALKEFRSLPGPFNLAINYYHATSWRHSSPVPPTLRNLSTANYWSYLDECARQNISCMLGLPQQRVLQGSGEALVAQLAAPLVDHPALLGYYLYDEPWLVPTPPPTKPDTISIQSLARVYNALKAADGGSREVVPCQAAHWIDNDHGAGWGPPSTDFQKEQSGEYNLSSFADRVMFDYYLVSSPTAPFHPLQKHTLGRIGHTKLHMVSSNNLFKLVTQQARLNATDRDRHVNAWWNVSARAGRFARDQHARHGL